jgi:aspartate kinase
MRLREGASADYCASRGEYLSGRVLSCAWDAEFIDAADVVRFRADGALDELLTLEAFGTRLHGVERAVVPGFYGSLPDGEIKTFSRGGSDITGALAAWAAAADLYENWTDVDGVLAADPRIVPSAATISSITYRELRELSYMGATVLHEDAIFPVRKAGIPINIRNTNAPELPGTMITALAAEDRPKAITGIAGRKGFSVINVEKAMMNSELGFGRKVLSVLENHGISFEHLPSGIDTLSVVVETAYLNECRSKVLDELFTSVDPDDVEIIDGLALIATVGRGMVRNPGTAARVFSALSHAHINVRMIDQGSSELNIIVGVVIEDFEAAIAAIYHEFVA